jgi:pyrroloquinoline quinone biosynthesis protein B
MQVKILGSAAGGAFPQWNCACRNCHAVRGGQFQGKSRSQTQVAVSADGEAWFLLGASPDLRAQIESTPELHPRSGTRSSPIRDVVLISADLDHVLGLLLMRELQSYRVHAAEPVIQLLRGNPMFAMLTRVPDQVQWQTIHAGERFVLGDSRAKDSIGVQAIAVSSHAPAYAVGMKSEEATLGIILTAPSGATLGFFPQIANVTSELKSIFDSLDCLLLDGTFWSDDEMIRLQGSNQSARGMGHVPVGGVDGTLQQLSGLTKPRKMYIHINNTNPMLNEASAEYRGVREAGWELAEDGCHFTL